ncbi:MAG: hypothetical protein ACK4GR_05995, partial [bacterium]
MVKRKMIVFVVIIAALFLMVGCSSLFKSSFKGSSVNNPMGTNVLPTWARKYSTSLRDSANFILPVNDGYIISGLVEVPTGGVDGFAIKTDPNGQIIWQRSYSGEENDVLKFTIPTSDGGFVLLGETSSFSVNNGGIIAIKVNSQGDIQWAKAYDSQNQDFVNSVFPISDGILIAGESGGKPFLAKISYQGELNFWKIFVTGNQGMEGFRSVVNVNEGGQDYYILGGWGYFHPNEYGISDGFIVKVNASNNQIIWAKSIRKNDINDNNHSTDVISFVVPVDNGYVLLGKTGYQAYELSFMKIDLNGNSIWAKYFDVPLEPANFIPTENGFLILADDRESHLYIIKTQNNGQIEDVRRFYSPENNLVIAAFLNYSYFNGFVFAANFSPLPPSNIINNNILNNFVSGTEDFVVVKTDQNGFLDPGTLQYETINNIVFNDYQPIIEDVDLQISDET